MNYELVIIRSGWASFFVGTQPYYPQAEQYFRLALQQKKRVYTTNYVIAELVALLNSPLRISRSRILAMTTATLESIKTIPFIPDTGQKVLSVNLALVDLTELTMIAQELGFKATLVQIQGKSGIQVHALLWSGAIADTPSDLDARVDVLADRIDTAAIRYVIGAWTHQEA